VHSTPHSGSRSLTDPAAEALRIPRSDKIDCLRDLIIKCRMQTLPIVKVKITTEIFDGFPNRTVILQIHLYVLLIVRQNLSTKMESIARPRPSLLIRVS